MTTPVDVSKIDDERGILHFLQNRPEKLTAKDLQALLDRKCELVNSGRPNEGPQTIDDGVSLVTVITSKDKALKREVDQLWSNYKGTSGVSKTDFKRLMQLSLQLAAGHLKSTDPKVWYDCKNFVGKLSFEHEDAWKNWQVPEKFQSLKTFFQGQKTSEAPASTTAAETSAVADPLSGFMPKGTDLGAEQLFDRTHWNLPAAGSEDSEKISWHRGYDMPVNYQENFRKAFQIHEALLEATAWGQGVIGVRVDLVPDDLGVGNATDILATLKLLAPLANGAHAKQTIDALGLAVTKYAQHVKHQERIKNKTPGP